MKTIKVAEATGAALDWLVAKAQGELTAEVRVGKATTKAVIVDDGGGPFSFRIGAYFRPSTDWSQAGPILEKELIAVSPYGYMDEAWRATTLKPEKHFTAYGDTPLIAAMRCYCQSKLGDTAEVPEELL